MTGLPNTFIIGAPKCGTTTLWELMRQHPEIQFSEVKEPNHFNTDMELAFGSMPHRDARLYRELFEGLTAPRIGEASVWYLYSKVAIPRIATACPDARIIVALRPPADAIRSMHAFSVLLGGEEILDLRRACEAESRRRSGAHPAGVQIVQSLYYKDIFRFAPQVRRVLQHHARSRVHFVLLEDLQHRPVEASQAVFRFLEVDPSFVPEISVTNRTEDVRRTPFAHTYRRFPRLRRVAARFLPRELRLTAESAVATLLRRATRIPTVDSDFVSQLARELSPDVDELSQLIGRDLSHWNPR